MPPLTRTRSAAKPPPLSGRSASPPKRARPRTDARHDGKLVATGATPPATNGCAHHKEPESVSLLAVLFAATVCGFISLCALAYIVTLPSYLLKSPPLPALPPPPPPNLAETFSIWLGGVVAEVGEGFKR